MQLLESTVYLGKEENQNIPAEKMEHFNYKKESTKSTDATNAGGYQKYKNLETFSLQTDSQKNYVFNYRAWEIYYGAPKFKDH